MNQNGNFQAPVISTKRNVLGDCEFIGTPIENQAISISLAALAADFRSAINPETLRAGYEAQSS